MILKISPQRVQMPVRTPDKSVDILRVCFILKPKDAYKHVEQDSKNTGM